MVVGKAVGFCAAADRTAKTPAAVTGGGRSELQPVVSLIIAADEGVVRFLVVAEKLHDPLIALGLRRSLVLMEAMPAARAPASYRASMTAARFFVNRKFLSPTTAERRPPENR